MRHLNIKIYGRVQGVFFRHSAKKFTEELGIVGFARNEPDGHLYIEAEGNGASLNNFLEWCRNGPPLASVSRIEFDFSDELRNFEKFEIL